MIGSGLFISVDDLRGMDPVLRSKLEGWLNGGNGPKASPAKVPGASPDAVPDAVDDDDWGPSDLSVQQAKRVVHGCSDKTKTLLRAVFSKGGTTFVLDEIAAEMGSEKGALGGMWAGITKRIRNVLGDKQARLFYWEWNEAEEHWTASSSKMTYHSMRQALGLE